MSMIVWIYGLPGSGKTTILRALVAYGWSTIDSDHGDVRLGLQDTPLVAHVLLSKAIGHQSKIVAVSSLLPIEHPWLITVGIQCPIETRRSRKPDYYEKLESGLFHRNEGLLVKSVDLFPTKLTGHVLNGTDPIDYNVNLIIGLVDKEQCWTSR